MISFSFFGIGSFGFSNLLKIHNCCLDGALAPSSPYGPGLCIGISHEGFHFKEFKKQKESLGYLYAGEEYVSVGCSTNLEHHPIVRGFLDDLVLQRKWRAQGFSSPGFLGLGAVYMGQVRDLSEKILTFGFSPSVYVDEVEPCDYDNCVVIMIIVLELHPALIEGEGSCLDLRWDVGVIKKNSRQLLDGSLERLLKILMNMAMLWYGQSNGLCGNLGTPIMFVIMSQHEFAVRIVRHFLVYVALGFSPLEVTLPRICLMFVLVNVVKMKADRLMVECCWSFFFKGYVSGWFNTLEQMGFFLVFTYIELSRKQGWGVMYMVNVQHDRGMQTSYCLYGVRLWIRRVAISKWLSMLLGLYLEWFVLQCAMYVTTAIGFVTFESGKHMKITVVSVQNFRMQRAGLRRLFGSNLNNGACYDGFDLGRSSVDSIWVNNVMRYYCRCGKGLYHFGPIDVEASKHVEPLWSHNVLFIVGNSEVSRTVPANGICCDADGIKAAEFGVGRCATPLEEQSIVVLYKTQGLQVSRIRTFYADVHIVGCKLHQKYLAKKKKKRCIKNVEVRIGFRLEGLI